MNAMNDEVAVALDQVAAIGKQFYRGYMLAPARTPGKVRVLNADASAVLPLSLRIYDGVERAQLAIRDHLVMLATRGEVGGEPRDRGVPASSRKAAPTQSSH